MKKKYLSLLIFIFILSGCSTGARRKEKPIVADQKLVQVYQNAKKSLSKDSSPAIMDLKKIVQNHSNSDIAVPSALALADYYYSRQKLESALEYYNFVIENDFYTSKEVEAVNKSIEIYQQLNQKSRGLELVDRLLGNSDLPTTHRHAYLKIKYNLSEDLLPGREQLATLAELYKTTESIQDKNSYLLKAMNVVEGRIKTEDLSGIIENSSFSFVHAPIAFRLASISFDNSDLGNAKYYLNKVISLQPDSDIAERSQDLLNQISSREVVSPKTIGVILPLSGKHEAIGKSVLYSIQYALDLYGDKASPYKLSIIDSEGKASAAQRGVEKLVMEDHAIAIIEGLLSKTASAVAAKSQSLGVPTIVLSQKSDITDAGDFIFRNALTGKMQVQYLVKDAIEKRGLTKFAILYPNDSYGVEYANLFWDEVVAQGGKVAAAQSYSPEETDFRKPIQRLVGTYYVDDRDTEYSLQLKEWYLKQNNKSSRKKIPDDILPPIVDFEAIFIPDSAKALGQISAMLAYNDVTDVMFLGTNLWNTPTIGSRVGKFMRSSLFVDSFLNDDPFFKDSAFVRNYKIMFGKDPSVFDLQAYDSAILLKSILRSGVDTRRGVQQKLIELKNLPASLGNISVLPNREVTRPLVPLTLSENGQIIRAN